MLCNRHTFVLIAGCAFAAMCGPAFAADLTIAPSGPAIQKSRLAKPHGKKPLNSHADKNKHAEQSRILTYSLYRDPLSRIAAPVADKRHFEVASRVAGLGSGLGYTVSPVPIQNTPRANTAFDAEPEDNAAIAFGCSQKPFAAATATMRREVTACFRHNVDKSWKAQTFFTRGYAPEGSQKPFAAGLSLAFAY